MYDDPSSGVNLLMFIPRLIILDKLHPLFEIVNSSSSHKIGSIICSSNHGSNLVSLDIDEFDVVKCLYSVKMLSAFCNMNSPQKTELHFINSIDFIMLEILLLKRDLQSNKNSFGSLC